ncbi:alpha/beta hydrolase [Rhizobium alvei]|uniref:Alpha/beta fold hydrolase n=1 Tax=Rhizobium alvei TaxID=1132659 RepID=A0ABT8YPS7_9HYPH|nr:alpha/beta hydrolase [Rhizobium alvei]MDO6965730.1 alpha/beta fold hydrolase [Rhizobium alvei]
MILWGLLIIVVALLGAFLFGPRTPVDTTVRFDPSKIGSDLDAYLAEREQGYSDIKPGQAKSILWADPVARRKTPVALLYIHGFSASSGEIRPVPERVAQALGANLYFARLAGHGRSHSDAMGEATVNDWVNDLAEAVEIGHRLGDRVVVIATSTGASLVTWALADPQFADRIDAAVFISPNYGVKANGAFALTLPFARQIAHVLVGDRRGFEPANALQAALWTTDYPVEALLPMAEIVRLAAGAEVGKIRTPVLFLISPLDEVVDPVATKAIAARWSGPNEIAEIDTQDPSHHVLAGDALSPSSNDRTVQLASDWFRKL